MARMYTVDEIAEMCGKNPGNLPGALMEGLESCTALEEGALGKLMTIGSLVAGTLLTGCAGNMQAKPSIDGHEISVDSTARVDNDSINALAMDIAGGIRDEMADSNSVTDTKAWQAAKDIYGKLVDSDRKGLADMFARTINRENRKLFNAPPCCDDRNFDNAEQEDADHTPVYDEETGMMEYN